MGDAPKPSGSGPSGSRDKPGGARQPRLRIYERPRIAEKDRSGRQSHPVNISHQHFIAFSAVHVVL